jgi:hypothetical protein
MPDFAPRAQEGRETGNPDHWTSSKGSVGSSALSAAHLLSTEAYLTETAACGIGTPAS